ncbi:MAG: alpha/beta fold hydrolase [Bacteroidales bacterium]
MNTMKQQICLILFIGISLAFNGCEKEPYDMDEPGNLVPKTVMEDPFLPRLEVNGTTLHAETMGDIEDPIIVFLHGGPGSDYRSMISQKGMENASRYPEERNVTNGGLSQLQDTYFCVFYDQRGAGLSPRFNKGEVTFDLYIEDLDAIIDYYLDKKFRETGIQETQVYIVGWSFGGTLATGYINEHPDKIKDLVLYEPGPIAKNIVDYFVDNTTSVFGQIGNSWLEDFLLSHDHFTADDHARADYQFLLGAFRSNPQFHEDINCPLWRMGIFIEHENLDFFASDRFDITSGLSAFEGRFLMVCGELTIHEYPDYPAMEMSHFPISEYVEIYGVGHTGPWEKPDEIASLIRTYFQ